MTIHMFSTLLVTHEQNDYNFVHRYQKKKSVKPGNLMQTEVSGVLGLPWYQPTYFYLNSYSCSSVQFYMSLSFLKQLTAG